MASPFVGGPAGLPQRFGGFRLVREIGRGGMGVVYEAIDDALNRPVALKVLPFHALTGAEPVERFRREARASANLQHRSIVPILGVGEQDGVHYYAMQFIEGESLDHVLEAASAIRRPGRAAAGRSSPSDRSRAIARALLSDRFDSGAGTPGTPTPRTEAATAGSPVPRGDATVKSTTPGPSSRNSIPPPAPGPAPPAADKTVTEALLADGFDPGAYFHSVARLLRDAADAVAYANERGVLHRDLKPANLLVDTRGHLWVTDFGLAITAGDDRLTLSGDVVGTLRYMAPERFRGVCDQRSDVYGLGITLYEALVGEPAFPEEAGRRLPLLVLEGVSRLPREVDPSIPADLEGIVLKAVAPEPEWRYSSSQELAQDLTRFLENRPPVHRSTASRFRRRPLGPRRRGVLLAALLALIILSASGGVYAWWAGLHRPQAVQRIAVGDFDGDGRVDVVTANGESASISFLRNQGSGSLSVAAHYPVGEKPFCVLPIRFAGRSSAGVVVSSYGSRRLSMFRWAGGDGFVLAGELALGSGPEFAAAFEDQGVQRLAVATEDQMLRAMKVEDQGLITAGGMVELPAPGKVIEPADFDGDRNIDLAVSHGTGSHHFVSILKGLGEGKFAPPVALGPFSSSWGLKACDLNGDGKTDLAVSPFSESKIWVSLNTGRGELGPPSEIRLSGGVQAVTAGDLNQDGFPDLAVAGSQRPYVCILWGRGDGVFGLRTDLPPVGEGPSSIEAADFDGDQDLDLVVANFLSNDVVVYFNDSNGRFDRHRALPLLSWWARLRKPAAP